MSLVEKIVHSVAQRVAKREWGEHYVGYESGAQDAAEDYVASALKALSDAGWQCVPKEPTEEIYEAYDSVPKSECPCVRYDKRESGDMTNEDYQQWVRETCDLDYRAMIAAAPEVT